MRTALAVLIVGLLATTAFAGANPQVYAYLTTDATGATIVDRADPVGGGNVTIYLYLDCFGLTGTGEPSPPAGVVTWTGKIVPTPGMFGYIAFDGAPGTLLSPGAYNTGISVSYGEGNCQSPGPVHFATLNCFSYLGGLGDFVLSGHPTFTPQRQVQDCATPTGTDEWCLLSNLGINQDPTAGEDCPCGGSAVEESSWGTIKALYR